MSRAASVAPRVVLALLLLAATQSCAVEQPIDANAVMPPGATEIAPPQDFAEKMLGVNASQYWIRGFKWTRDWDRIVSHVDRIAIEHGYGTYQPPPIANLDKLGLKEADVYRVWLSPTRTLGIGLMNLKAIRDKGGKFEGAADYVIFSIGGSQLHPAASK